IGGVTTAVVPVGTVPSLCGLILCLMISGSGEPEIIKHRINPHKLGTVPTGTTAVVTPPIVYGGGDTISTPTIYFVWYGNWSQASGSDTLAGQQVLRDFAKNIGGSPYFQINTTYSTPAKTITGSVGFGGESFDSYSKGTRLRDADVLSI